MRNLDFSSLHALVTTLLSLAVITLLGVGIRLLTQFTIQQRRERTNRQINERLRALMAAYKTLGGSFTGDMTVSPMHRRDTQRRGEAATIRSEVSLDLKVDESPGSDRTRRVRDAVEAALSDIILLGTEEQVRLAVQAAHELAAGRLVHTQELVTSLRNFIREALDLDPIPFDLEIPQQGPARPAASGGREKADREARQSGGSTGGGGDAGGAGAGGGGLSFGSGFRQHDDDDDSDGGESSTHHA